MKTLNIRVNLGDDGFHAIASCVKRVKNLVLGDFEDTELTLKGIRALAQEVCKLDKPVR